MLEKNQENDSFIINYFIISLRYCCYFLLCDLHLIILLLLFYFFDFLGISTVYLVVE
ncbi:hypothetical protein MEG1DRAFT_03610 [Photorhabdus temperata subsp. temperata Meg1]|uniref:Uncharacterized protein n=1 Tax=Photorhabdus temperata subsp. temperata Meg1 TaxID=1393735 RepID=A0A081RSX4_PHOTE|nr:hypothetical protein MEG1DRAFT_03610 [Photorhabdus temperata subsp. temperata Meg1]